MNSGKTLAAAALAAFIGGAVVTVASPAAARTVCNDYGRCWHVSDYGHDYYRARYSDWWWRHHHYWRDRDGWRHRDWRDRDRYDRDHRDWDDR